MTELLFVCFIFLMFTTYFLFDGDMLAPSFVFCSTYAFCIGCALVNKNQWELDISDMTFWVLLSGAFVFIFANVVCKAFIVSKRQIRREVLPIFINKKLTKAIVVFDYVFLCAWIYNVYKIASYFGGVTSIGVMMSVYRLKTSYEAAASMPGLLNQLVKIVTACAYIYLFSFINNVVVKTWRRTWIYLIPIIIYIVFSLFASNRLNILYIAAAGVTYYFLVKRYQLGKPKKSLKLILKLIGLFFLLLAGFYVIRLMIGRLTSQDKGLIQYITSYAGGSIKLLDLFFESPQHSNIWGKETFISLLGNLKGFHLIHFEDYISHKEFRTVNGLILGNIYTAYRSWYADFKMPGVMILNLGFAMFFNVFYYQLLHHDYMNNKLLVILYGYLMPALFLHPIDDCFYKYVFCLGFLLYLLIYYMLINGLLGGFKIKFRK